MAAPPKQKSLYEGADSNTEVTPLAKHLKERMSATNIQTLRVVDGEAADPAAAEAPAHLPGVTGPTPTHLPPDAQPALTSIPAISESNELDPLANLFAPPKSQSSSKSRRSSKSLPIQPLPPPPPPSGPRWLVLPLSLSVVINIVLVVALNSAYSELHQKNGKSVTGAVIATPPVAAPEGSAGNACMRQSTQTISGPERDQLLLEIATTYDSGQHAKALALLKRYVAESCDAATVEAMKILERDLSAKKEPAR